MSWQCRFRVGLLGVRLMPRKVGSHFLAAEEISRSLRPDEAGEKQTTTMTTIRPTIAVMIALMTKPDDHHDEDDDDADGFGLIRVQRVGSHRSHPNRRAVDGRYASHCGNGPGLREARVKAHDFSTRPEGRFRPCQMT